MKITIGILSIGLLLGACSGAENQDELASELNDALESVSQDASKFSGKLDELLTLEVAATCSGLAKEKVKVKYNQTLKNPEYHSLAYEWPSERIRKMKINSMEMEFPKVNMVQISWVRASNLKDFSFNYHNPTKEELANARNAMNAKEAELVKDGKATKDQMGAADKMANDMIANYNVIDVPNLGEKAVWIQRKEENQLKVLYKGIEFQIIVDLSDNEEDNKEKSIKLAKEIIDTKLN